ncbi:MAG: sugar phosphate isomerase/epimerase [Oscillospiraceae bacterium]|nr:sugar phosphate isomerase/epimerase [Oscillospiraceae bacterium]
MIRFGGPVFESDMKAAGAGESHGAKGDPRLIARSHRLKGYTAAYVPHVELSDKERVREIREAFAAEGVMLAEVGYWQNITDLDAEVRKKHLKCLTDAMYLAEEVGARCAVDIFGSYVYGNGNTSFVAENFSEDAFADAVDIARGIIDEVRPKSAYFTYEIFPFNVVDCPESLERLIKAVDRAQFGVHLDLANLINCPRAYFASGELMRDCVRRFGDRIVAAHVKDIKLKEPAISVILNEVVAGTGGIDMHAFVRGIHGLPQDVPFMMEHLAGEAEYDQAAAYIRKCAADEGIKI